MNLDDFDDGPEETQHTPAERASAGTGSTWVSMGVDPWRRPDLGHAAPITPESG